MDQDGAGNPGAQASRALLTSLIFLGGNHSGMMKNGKYYIRGKNIKDAKIVLEAQPQFKM